MTSLQDLVDSEIFDNVESGQTPEDTFGIASGSDGQTFSFAGSQIYFQVLDGEPFFFGTFHLP